MKHWFLGESIYLNIENVVASARLDENINLDLIARLFHVKYPDPDQYPEEYPDQYPEQFPGLVLRICRSEQNPEGFDVLIFGSGQMLLSGARSEQEAHNALSGLIKQLSRARIVTSRKLDIKIQNIVGSAALGEPIDLEKAACCNRGVMYEPEQFPGLIYKMDDPKVVILLFASGKLVCTGAKKETEVHRAVMKLKRLLQGSRSWDDKHTVDVLEVSNAIPFPNASLEAISGAVKGKALERMMKEAVDCPVKAKRVSFVECFTCSNFNQRIKGKVGCAGLPIVGP
jgi:transcription initiation factor TFIID TATA-box-binding protein